MSLIFTSEEITARERGLTFDDVLLIPNHSEISSRRLPDLTAQVTKRYRLDVPIISANMDTITGVAMANAMADLGGLGILHRFMSKEEQIEDVRAIQKFLAENKLNTPISASIGVKEEGKQRADVLSELGVQILTIDIAHGDSILMLETLDYVKKRYPQIDVIAGNVATPDAVKRLCDHGADAVKVGIGPGSMCTTRVITGHGVPQLTAIAICVAEAKKHGVPVIADGGIRNSGDIVKAFAAGAQTVMLGSMFSGTIETPGEIKGGMKQYRGMASKAAQVSWRGELPQGMAAEGESTMVPCKGSVRDLVHEITGGIRSGMTYMGTMALGEMAQKSRFMEMSPAGANESRAHGVR